MGAKKAKTDEITLVRPRLKQLTVKNFRCIGETPVSIDLDDIVVLVGPNNAGKSSILRAYEVAMLEGSNEGKLKIEDFPGGAPDPDKLPEVELITIVEANTPGEDWIATNADGEMEVRERWRWEGPNQKPKRQGWHVKDQDWSDSVPWGAPNVANSRRPEPHHVSPFDDPEVQSKQIVDILKTALKQRLESLKDDEEEESAYKKLLNAVGEVHEEVVQQTREEIDRIETDLREAIQAVFPDHDVRFDAKPEEELGNLVKLFEKPPEIKMGLKDGFQGSVASQGSGTRRTLLWMALRIVADENRRGSKSERPHVLLLDEPEICLHPSAIREACDVLYRLPRGGSWQVMVTTHSPAFIDVSRDNTTIVRVERSREGVVSGTTVFRPSRARFDENDEQQLKLLNLCDPYVAEFFFGGTTVLVEGDTEYTAFNYVRKARPEKYAEVHIVRARGKATIVSLMKILNQFGSPYSVLHDSDYKKAWRKDGTEMDNPAWTQNWRILDETKHAKGTVSLVASVPNFEEAYLDGQLKGTKPYNALRLLAEGDDTLRRIEALLDALVDSEKATPGGAVRWTTQDELDKVAPERRANGKE